VRRRRHKKREKEGKDSYENLRTWGANPREGLFPLQSDGRKKKILLTGGGELSLDTKLAGGQMVTTECLQKRE